MRILPATWAADRPSLDRQLADIRRVAKHFRLELVPTTEEDYDLGGSGATSPFDRPGLGKWFRQDRSDQWDALVVAKLDRLCSSGDERRRLVEWLASHDKGIVIADFIWEAEAS